MSKRKKRDTKIREMFSFKKGKNTPPYQNHLDAPAHIAFVVDDIVEDIIHCNERLGKLLLSNPKIIDISLHKDVNVGYYWDDENQKFIDVDTI